MHRTASTQRPPNEIAARGILFSKLADPGTATEQAADFDLPSGQKPERELIATRTKQLIFRLAVHEASHAVIRLYLGLGTITSRVGA